MIRLLSALLFIIRLAIAKYGNECLDTRSLSSVNVRLPGDCGSVRSYVAINASLWPEIPRFACHFPFLPASRALLDTEKCRQQIDSNVDNLVSSTLEPSVNTLNSTRFSDLDVLLVNIYWLKFPGSSSIELCATNTNKTGPRCMTENNRVSANHQDIIEEPYYAVLTQTYNLSVFVTINDYKPTNFNESLRFVVTSAHRLNLGEFTCPAGLFACNLTEVAIKGTNPKVQNRFCLPMGLWCDGVPNCPGSASDESDCNAGISPPTTFTSTPDIIEAEARLYNDSISKQNNALVLLWFILPILTSPIIVLAVFMWRRKPKQNLYNPPPLDSQEQQPNHSLLSYQQA